MTDVEKRMEEGMWRMQAGDVEVDLNYLHWNDSWQQGRAEARFQVWDQC